MELSIHVTSWKGNAREVDKGEGGLCGHVRRGEGVGRKMIAVHRLEEQEQGEEELCADRQWLWLKTGDKG